MLFRQVLQRGVGDRYVCSEGGEALAGDMLRCFVVRKGQMPEKLV